jgi:hypothetical protein
MSLLEPLPGAVGLTKVVSMRVHPSPLKRQGPSGYECGANLLDLTVVTVVLLERISYPFEDTYIFPFKNQNMVIDKPKVNSRNGRNNRTRVRIRLSRRQDLGSLNQHGLKEIISLR